MKKQGIIISLEGVLVFPEDVSVAEDALIYDFLLSHRYIFHVADLEGRSAAAFLEEISVWRGNDAIILQEERAKLKRQVLWQARKNPEAAGVLQVLSQKYTIVILSAFPGSAIVKALADIGVRGFVHFIVAGESWVGRDPFDLGINLAMAKYPEIETKNWAYIRGVSQLTEKSSAKVNSFIYGSPPFNTLADLME